MREAEGRLCPACSVPAAGGALECEACGFVLDVRTAAPALQRALEAAEEETAQIAIARALIAIPGMDSERYVRDWLLRRIPMSHSASAMVEVLGAVDDTQARAEASRLAIANFREKKLPGRWEVTLASLSTPEARRALLAALTDKDDTARWTAAQAILEHWEEIPAEALPVLRKVLKNRREHDEVRFCAAGALARVDDLESRKEFLPRLQKALRELDGANPDEFPLPTRAARLLCGVADTGARREALEFLARRLPDGSEPILALALPPLLTEGADWFVASLINACRNRHPRSPSAATLARAFGDLRLPRLRIEAWERLREALAERPSSAAHPCCLTFVAALGHLRRPESAPYLEGLWKDAEDAAVRDAALEALARLGHAGAVRVFAEYIAAAPGADDESRDEWVRSAQKAAEVLADVRGPEATPQAIHALVRALAESQVAREAARALREVACAAPEPPAPAVERREARPAARQEEAAPAPAAEVAPSPAPPVAPSLGTAGGPETGATDTPAPRPPLREVAPPPRVPVAAAAEAIAGDAQREHRLVAVLEEVQRQVSALPHQYFTYDPMGPMERAEKDRTLRLMACGSLHALAEATAGIAATSAAPVSGPTLALAHYLQARVYHAMACDPQGRGGAGRERYHQRLENLNRAEECYRRAVEATDVAVYRARAYFDLAVLLAESERKAEALTAFEAVTDLDVSGYLGQAAEENVKRLRATPEPRSTSRGRRRRAPFRRALTRSMVVAAAATMLWAGWAQSLHPRWGEAAIWDAVRSHRWPIKLAQLQQAPQPQPAPARALGTVVVSAGRLRVRSGRGQEHAVIGTARRGQRLTVIRQTEAWWKVRFANGVEGWVARDYTGPLSR